jgi:acyl carrier protein
MMSIASMSMIEHTTAMRDGPASGTIRALIAKHLGVEIERVTDDAHFADDLGADWLDRVELVIAIEDQFAGVEITDDDVDRINVVRDLLRCIEMPPTGQTGAIAARCRGTSSGHKFLGPRRSHAEWGSQGSKSAAAK